MASQTQLQVSGTRVMDKQGSRWLKKPVMGLDSFEELLQELLHVWDFAASHIEPAKDRRCVLEALNPNGG